MQRRQTIDYYPIATYRKPENVFFDGKKETKTLTHSHTHTLDRLNRTGPTNATERTKRNSEAKRSEAKRRRRKKETVDDDRVDDEKKK